MSEMTTIDLLQIFGLMLLVMYAPDLIEAVIKRIAGE